MSQLLVRTLSAIVFGVAVIGLTFWGRMQMSILFGIFSLITYWEFISLPKENKIPFYLKALSLGGAILVYMLLSHLLIDLMPSHVLLFWLLLVPIYLIIALFSKDHPINTTAVPVFGLIYTVVPFALLADMGTHHGVYIPELILFPLFLIWIYDSGAYIVGSKIGKTKLFESVSPKKSWEGAIGGAVLCLAGVFLFSNLNDHYDLLEWMIVGGIVIVFGTLGDLVESRLKRHFDVKDSGSIMPGHGGLLDRFDAWILIIPVLYVFKTFVLS